MNLVRRDRLDADDVAAVTELVDEVTAADGVRPLSEHVMLHLRHGGDAPARNFLLYDDDNTLVGYGHLDATDVVEGASGELAVRPTARRHGYGRALVDALAADIAPQNRLRLWSHGSRSGAGELARAMGFKRERVLWQMRRSLFAPVPEPQWPSDVTVRTFIVGQDEKAWLEVNNRAFANLPDQGSWTIDDLRMREDEPWFDPSGFFMAERAGELVGFHWTKVHGHHEEHEPIGEVYVVGVDPSMQGQKLGPALTLRGLQYLRARGLSQVMLYVDEKNTNAIRTYERLGFAKWDVDVCFLQQ